VGKLRVRKTTYTQVFEGRFIVIPNVLTLICDFCGEKVFDNEMLRRLSGLLDQGRAITRNIAPPHSRP
jgi:YgiT-type zinc finger domain-containing protein